MPFVSTTRHDNETRKYHTMKLTKTILAVLATAALTLGSAQAVQISGDIDFAGQAFFNTNSLATATQVVNFRSGAGVNHAATVTDATGSFATTVSMGDTASFPSLYQFNPSAPATPLWTVGGFTFDLTSSTVMLQNSRFLVIEGIGILTGNGFDATVGTWAFTSQQSDGSNRVSFSFSSNNAAVPGQVPDGGTTVALLGAALTGVAALRRKLAIA